MHSWAQGSRDECSHETGTSRRLNRRGSSVRSMGDNCIRHTQAWEACDRVTEWGATQAWGHMTRELNRRSITRGQALMVAGWWLNREA